MTIEAHVVDVLLADSAVAAIVGTRVFPVVVRKTTDLPGLTYARLGQGERTYSLAGRAGMATTAIGLNACALTYTQARALADAVRDALDAYGDANIQVAWVIDGDDDYQAPSDDTIIYVCRVVVNVMYTEV